MLRLWTTRLLLLGCLATTASAQDDEDELPDYRTGLVARYTGADGWSIVRRDGDVQFAWQAESPDSRLPAGRFSARWEGRLFVMSPGPYRLHVYAAGKVRLSILGQQCLAADLAHPNWIVSEPIELDYGYHPLVLEYERTSDDARLGLFWSGPQFQLEPIPERNLMHEPKQAPDESFSHGRLLARALRCEACHNAAERSERLTAPDLSRLRGNLEPAWVDDWLTAAANPVPAKPQADNELARRMPHFGLRADDVRAITAYLFAQSRAPEPKKKPRAADIKKVATAPKPVEAKPAETKPANGNNAKKKPKPKPRTTPSAIEGEQLIDTIGCLACHRIGDRGTAALFGGGDLTAIARKRPADFFDRWLENPAAINAAHRMPVFQLSPLERADLALYLQTLKPGHDKEQATAESSGNLVERGERLVGTLGCANCHTLTAAKTAQRRVEPLTSATDWSRGCLVREEPAKGQPVYRLSDTQAATLQKYFHDVRPSAEDARTDGQFVMAERNCLGCHSRGVEPGIAAQTLVLTAGRPDLAPLLPALAPPSLSGVGDKLHREALEAAILVKNAPLRPWLKIRMPRFPLTADEMHAIVGHLTEHDRIPELPAANSPAEDEPTRLIAGSRLVTADGFGCTSCHQIGHAEPLNVALAAHGTDLSLVGSRIRRPWFDRWVRNPARIVPRMEMPAIQQPVRGVMHENLVGQLEAVWTALNTAGFEPPQPNPVRVVRARNLPDKPEPASLLTDVIEIGKTPYLRPLVIGLPNRQNILFDLETNRLTAWWIGDTARERTRGKSWFWEAGGPPLVPVNEGTVGELRLKSGDGLIDPLVRGQVAAQLESFEQVERGVRFTYYLAFERGSKRWPRLLKVVQTFQAPRAQEKGRPAIAFTRTIEIEGGSADDAVYFHPLPGTHNDSHSRWSAKDAPGSPSAAVRLIQKAIAYVLAPGDFLLIPNVGESNRRACEIDYYVDLPADTFPVDPVAFPPDTPLEFKTVPGFEATRLPLPTEEMPTGLAWRKDGTLVISSLKGRVCLVRDTDGDGLEDQVKPFSDDLAAPYGVNCMGDAIDVVNKYALLRLHDEDHDGRAERTEVLADGWGYTADYHDWAVGLPRDREGNYYVALPCQQDDRSEAAAYLRGQTLKLVPSKPTALGQRPYRIEPLTAGHRFQMGLALNSHEDLFATDNQGNYTPFNELNHLVAGTRYGFINKLEVKPDFNPPFQPAAIELPHPWVRSTNGICFLDTPQAVREKLGRGLFGPFEGHIVGCEYTTRGLVRMSLEKVGDTYQGAVYPFSRPPADDEPTFEGPIVCSIAPDGDLYIGNLLDSAWGGGQNTGSIVRLRPRAERQPGIAEIRAARRGFTIDFTEPLDRQGADNPKHYSIISYRRIPTPAYGGADVDTQPSKVVKVEISPDARQAKLTLDSLRPGFVYEFRLSGLTTAGKPLFPVEAYYTLRRPVE